MNFQKQDIFTRRERDKRVAVFIHQDWLLENVKGLGEYSLRVSYRYKFLESVNKRHKKQSILPDTGASWRYAKKRSGFYYDYDRLPENRKKQLPAKDDLLALYEKSQTKEAISQLESDLLAFISDLSPWLKLFGECTDIQAEHLARAAAVVTFAANEVRAQPPTSSNEYYRLLSAIVVKHGWVYLPKNYRRLKDKITPVVEGAKITKVIRLPRQGNSNRGAYDNQQVIAWMMYLRSRPENYGNAHIARRILKMCSISRIEAPSFSWIEHYLSRNATKWLTGAARHRSGRRGGEYKDYLPVAGAVYAGDCWQVDGTRINFIPHQSADGKERSLMIIAIRDVHSGDIIGYHLDTKEDRWGYVHAMNMAVRATGHLPYELVHDRFPGHNTPEWELITKRMEYKGVKVTVTSTATGKSHVERCFATIQDVFMQDFPWYYGQGIQSTREAARRSSEYLTSVKKRARKEGWTFDDAWRAASAVVENYRSTPLNEYSRRNAKVKESPRELYQISEAVNVVKVDEFERIELFGTLRPETIRNNGMITMRIQNVKYIYKIGIEHYDIILNYKKVKVYYDMEDLSKIYLFDPSDDINSKFLCEVIEETAVQYYGPDADMEKLAKMKKARKEIRDKRQADLEELTFGAADEVALLMPTVVGKTNVDTAETRFLEDTAKVWQDRQEKRIVKPTQPVEFGEDEELELVVVRNY